MGEVCVGLDISVDPAKTFVAVTEWGHSGVVVTEVRGGCDDDTVVDYAARGLMGIDCALGWPDAFVDFVAHAQRGLEHPIRASDAASWRRGLSLRHTDEFVVEATGQRPLSVSTDRLGVVAMRAASLLAQLRASGVPIVKDGTDPRVVEVYPAAALRVWSIECTGYKKSAAIRSRIVETLERELPGLEWGPDVRGWCIEVDHALDALIAALVTRAVAVGAYLKPPPGLEAHARREGWIAIPTVALAELS